MTKHHITVRSETGARMPHLSTVSNLLADDARLVGQNTAASLPEGYTVEVTTPSGALVDIYYAPDC